MLAAEKARVRDRASEEQADVTAARLRDDRYVAAVMAQGGFPRVVEVGGGVATVWPDMAARERSLRQRHYGRSGGR